MDHKSLGFGQLSDESWTLYY